MIFSSGFIEADDDNSVQTVIDELQKRNMEVTGVKNEKIVFLVERETTGEVKAALDSLKSIDGVRSVYLAYYSLDGGDEVEGGAAFIETEAVS
ncbi:MAG: chaperone NapD [Nitrospirae bacterium]|nr:chaperone NapD [Nitrospirota bacterium]